MLKENFEDFLHFHEPTVVILTTRNQKNLTQISGASFEIEHTVTLRNNRLIALKAEKLPV